MLCVKTYDDLRHTTIWNKKQFWYYVILLKPYDISPAGKVFLENLNYFHIDTGENCVYFIPGFLNTEDGIARRIIDFFKHSHIIQIENYGNVQFFLYDFIDCIHQLECNNNNQWRYSGECELLLFNIDENNRIIINDFASYNLDDIIRNGRTISTFIRETINIGKDACDKVLAKRRLDEIYASLILPPIQPDFLLRSSFVLSQMQNNGFQEGEYYFISYSSKDYWFVSRICGAIEQLGIKCWMAPRDIPRGINYAHIIEFAIHNAQQFIIILSNSSIWSVWVEKELQRAIHYFQHESASKIVAAWLDQQLNLDDTPMAYPMEGIQIVGQLKTVEDYRILLPSELQEKLKTRDKIETTLQNFQNNMVSPNSIKQQFTRLIGIAMSMKKHIGDTSDFEIINHLCENLKLNLQKINKLDNMKGTGCISLLSPLLEIEYQIEEVIQKVACSFAPITINEKLVEHSNDE